MLMRCKHRISTADTLARSLVSSNSLGTHFQKFPKTSHSFKRVYHVSQLVKQRWSINVGKKAAVDLHNAASSSRLPITLNIASHTGRPYWTRTGACVTVSNLHSIVNTSLLWQFGKGPLQSMSIRVSSGTCIGSNFPVCTAMAGSIRRWLLWQ